MTKTRNALFLAVAAFVGASLTTSTPASAGAFGYGYTSGYGYASGYFSIYQPVCFMKQVRVQTVDGWTVQKVRVCE